jgi:hypothetical protein
MHMDQNSPADKPTPIVPVPQAQFVTERRSGFYAERLAEIRTEISALMAEPYRYGREGPSRRRRDEDILLTIAADLNARMLEAVAP